MQYPIKGSLIIADGNGKVTFVEPMHGDMVISSDPNDPKGIKFVDRTTIAAETISKSTATDVSYITTSSYSTIMYFSVPGENTKKIKSIKVVSYMHSNIKSYDVRIYDQTNNTVIAESNFDNHKITINDMGTLSKLPTEEAVFEVHAAKNGGNWSSKVYILECTITYYN